jgi:hypothetical protein
LNTLCKRSIFFEDLFFGGFVCFWKENSFCELWEKFEKRSEKRMAEVEARPDDGQRTEQGGVEEGEIVSVETQVDRPAEAPKKHPLEHAWTFWFDNPNGKQKQVAWGSSIRAVYTFSTVEDFWWYVFPLPPVDLLQLFGVLFIRLCGNLPPPFTSLCSSKTSPSFFRSILHSQNTAAIVFVSLCSSCL